MEEESVMERTRRDLVLTGKVIPLAFHVNMKTEPGWPQGRQTPDDR